MTSVALRLLQSASAFASSGRSLLRPLSTSVNSLKIPLNHTEIVAAAKLLVEIRNELQDDLGAYAVAVRDQYGDEKLREFAHDTAHDENTHSIRVLGGLWLTIG